MANINPFTRRVSVVLFIASLTGGLTGFGSKDASAGVVPPKNQKALPAPSDDGGKSKSQAKKPRARDVRGEMSEFEAEIANRVIEQPEVVGVLSGLEWRKRLYGYGTRETPEVVYFMGGPATGKDTAVEAYIDVMYRPLKNAMDQHVYLMPVAKKDHEVWREFGSFTGHVGSENISPLISWLVEHSCGRYMLGKKVTPSGAETVFVLKNPKFEEGQDCPEGSHAPEDAVIFVNEFHDWGKSAKSLLLKQVLEKGYFPINNPGPGESMIRVPVTIIIASNEGLDLISARSATGERVGKMLTYDQMIAKHQAVAGDKRALKDAILATNTKALSEDAGEGRSGISEEMLRRIPDQNLVLMRPISLEGLRKIAGFKLLKLREKLQKNRGALGELNLRWTEKVVEYVANENSDPEVGAGKIKDNVSSLIEATVFDAIKTGEIPTDGQKKYYEIDIEEQPDRTLKLIFRKYAGPISSPDDKIEVTGEFKQNIASTDYRKPPAPMTTARIDQLANLGQEMKKQVFGIDPIVDRLAQAVLVSEERAQAGKHAKDAVPARSFMALGLSSTGKTETFKALARVLYGAEENMVVLDFSQIRTVEDLKNKILGTRNGYGVGVKSDFMEQYDRLNGKVLFVFDEIANAPREVLKALYDILRESEVTTFSDKRPRKMANVIIGMTGNAGEEWFTQIPRNIPVLEQQAAMEEIYKQATKDPDFRRGFLEKYFSQALLNRIGENNIFFFPPIGFKTLRELTQLKIGQALKRLEESPGRWGWKIRFLDQKDYVALVEAIETHGFVLWEQGSSIDRYVKQDVEEQLRHLLLKAHIPSGSEVVLSSIGTFDEEKDELHKVPRARFAVMSSNGTKAEVLNLAQQDRPTPERIDPLAQVITAYHEIGHELVRQALFSDKYRGERVTIVPGVAEINHQWIRYLGLAQYEQVEQLTPSRKAIVQKIAVFLAGEVAQELITKQYDGGKSNDIERATELARTAILKLGLSEAWGNEAAPPGVSLSEYADSLSEGRRKIYDRELHKLLNEGRTVASRVILANFDSLFTPMAVALAERGTLERQDLEAFYKETTPVNPLGAPIKAFFASLSSERLSLKMATILHRSGTRDASLLSVVPRPATIANIEAITAKRRAEAIARVPLPSHLPLLDGDQSGYVSALQALRENARAEAREKAAELRKTVPVSTKEKGRCGRLLSKS